MNEEKGTQQEFNRLCNSLKCITLFIAMAATLIVTLAINVVKYNFNTILLILFVFALICMLVAFIVWIIIKAKVLKHIKDTKKREENA